MVTMTQIPPKTPSKSESRLILIVEDSKPQALLLDRFLKRSGFKTHCCEDGDSALEFLSHSRPDIIVSDINMPGMNGFEMCSKIKSSPEWSAIPVILLTSLDGHDDVLNGLTADADFYLTKPYDPGFLLDRIIDILDKSADWLPYETSEGLFLKSEGKVHRITTSRARMLNLLLATYQNALHQNKELIETKESLSRLNKNLRDQSVKLQVSEKNFRSVLENNIDCMIVADTQGEIHYLNPAAKSWFSNKLQVKAFLDHSGQTFQPDIETECTLTLSDRRQIVAEMRIVETLWEGEDTLLISLRDITQRKLAEQKINEQQAKLQEVNQQLSELATQDGLTKLKNHRVFKERLTEEFTRTRLHHLPLSIILMDIDRFKQYNDDFGHPAGDQVLMKVAVILTQCTRETDLVARYGGEEFAIILPLADARHSLIIAERIREGIEGATWDHRPVTGSFGVTTYAPETANALQLIKQADIALYHSKNTGRNKSTHWADIQKT